MCLWHKEHKTWQFVLGCTLSSALPLNAVLSNPQRSLLGPSSYWNREGVVCVMDLSCGAKHMMICRLLVHISHINKYWKQQREWKFLSMWGMLHVYSSMHVTPVSSYLTAAILGQYFTALQRTCLSIIWSLSEDKCTKSHVNLLTAQNIWRISLIYSGATLSEKIFVSLCCDIVGYRKSFQHKMRANQYHV